METTENIGHLESDIKILKNEVQAVLLDLRDKYLEADNPFNAPSEKVATGQEQLAVDQQPADNDSKPQAEPDDVSNKKEEEDIPEETMAANETVKERHPERAREEVIKAHKPEKAPAVQKPQKTHASERELNLITIGGLVNWADESVKRLGLERTETILDVAEMMGLLSPDLKGIMKKFVSIDGNGNSEARSARAFLDSLVKITTLLGKDNQTEAALLSILSGQDAHG